MRKSIVAGVNRILGTYCKGAVDKKGDKILAGMLAPVGQQDEKITLTASKFRIQSFLVTHVHTCCAIGYLFTPKKIEVMRVERSKSKNRKVNNKPLLTKKITLFMHSRKSLR